MIITPLTINLILYWWLTHTTLLTQILITWIILGIITIGAFNLAKFLTARSRRPD